MNIEDDIRVLTLPPELNEFIGDYFKALKKRAAADLVGESEYRCFKRFLDIYASGKYKFAFKAMRRMFTFLHLLVYGRLLNGGLRLLTSLTLSKRLRLMLNSFFYLSRLRLGSRLSRFGPSRFHERSTRWAEQQTGIDFSTANRTLHHDLLYRLIAAIRYNSSDR